MRPPLSLRSWGLTLPRTEGENRHMHVSGVRHVTGRGSAKKWGGSINHTSPHLADVTARCTGMCPGCIPLGSCMVAIENWEV